VSGLEEGSDVPLAAWWQPGLEWRGRQQGRRGCTALGSSVKEKNQRGRRHGEDARALNEEVLPGSGGLARVAVLCRHHGEGGAAVLPLGRGGEIVRERERALLSVGTGEKIWR
jgi:hypothetical protein